MTKYKARVDYYEFTKNLIGMFSTTTVAGTSSSVENQVLAAVIVRRNSTGMVLVLPVVSAVEDSSHVLKEQVTKMRKAYLVRTRYVTKLLK